MKATLRMLDIVCKLPEDGQKWLKGMNREELRYTETILNNVGEDSFVKHWRVHKDELEYVRNF